jgi:hypothetical protein
VIKSNTKCSLKRKRTKWFLDVPDIPCTGDEGFRFQLHFQRRTSTNKNNLFIEVSIVYIYHWRSSAVLEGRLICEVFSPSLSDTWLVGCMWPAGCYDVSHLHFDAYKFVQTGPGTNPATNTMGTKSLSQA